MRLGTYSIVARDPASGEFGVAVQSHWFSVGSVVSWARAGVGAVATQSLAEISYGPNALDRLAAGEAAPDALAALLAADDLARMRQVAVVDAEGAVGVHTGDSCIPEAGHVCGDGFSCQANLMRSAAVPGAMAQAFTSATGELADRLLSALEAAEAAGGDIRGRQSAALLVVPREGEAWRRRVDLRVEDDPQPLPELARLLRLQRAYDLGQRADEMLGEGRLGDAAPLYRAASDLAPESHELLFWAGLGIAETGDLEAGTDAVRGAIDSHPEWAAVLERLTPELAPAARAVREALRRGEP